MLDVEFVHLTDDGKQRDHNEDFAGFVQPENSEEEQARGWMFALCDGVGGHDDGEIASKTAIEALQAAFRRAPRGRAAFGHARKARQGGESQGL